MRVGMLYLITGGSGSGKSEYAESVAVRLHKDRFHGGRLFYVAAMYPSDEECERRIARHRRMRLGKGFETVECFCGLERLLGQETGQDVFLIECLSNLLANERYRPEGGIHGVGEEAFAQAQERIFRPILQLSQRAGAVVTVTNEIFSDLPIQDEETELYCRLLGRLNVLLGAQACAAAEAVCGRAVCLKGEMPC